MTEFQLIAPTGPDRVAYGGHENSRAGTVVWLTPPHIIDALGPFDLDPCGATGWTTAKRHILLPQDGLRTPWEGRVWLNPPYSSEAWRWLNRLADHGHGTALIFARTETDGFFRTVWQRATALLFLHGRLTFHHANGKPAKATAGAPSVLVAYGETDAKRLQICGLNGTFVRLRETA
jgi:hypothetical protein